MEVSFLSFPKIMKRNDDMLTSSPSVDTRVKLFPKATGLELPRSYFVILTLEAQFWNSQVENVLKPT